MKKILAIIVTYNADSWLSTSLGSLIASSAQTSIAVVDNASADSTVEIINSKYLDYIDYFFPLQENLGFGGAHNYVFEQVGFEQFDYVFLLNQDAAISHNAIKLMLSVGMSNPNYGIISPMHYYKDGVLDQWFAKCFSKSILLPKKHYGSSVFEVDFVNAAIWLVKSEVFGKVGGFDQIHFHYGEDVTFAHRMTYLNYKTVIVENAMGYHFRSQTNHGMQTKTVAEKLFILNKIDILNPHISMFVSIGKLVFRSIKESVKAVLKGRISSSFYILGAFWNSVFIIDRAYYSRRAFSLRQKCEVTGETKS